MNIDIVQGFIQQDPRRLVRVAYALVHDWETSEDVAQEALLRAVTGQAAGSWRGAADNEVAICAWLSQTTRNLALNSIRDSKRRAVASDREMSDDEPPQTCVTCGQPEEAGRDPLLLTVEREQSTLIRDALAQLAPDQLEVFLLRHGESLSTRETAERIGISEDLVKYRLAAARRRARHALKAMEGSLSHELVDRE